MPNGEKVRPAEIVDASRRGISMYHAVTCQRHNNQAYRTGSKSRGVPFQSIESASRRLLRRGGSTGRGSIRTCVMYGGAPDLHDLG